jgi:hypothetical protein
MVAPFTCADPSAKISLSRADKSPFTHDLCPREMSGPLNPPFVQLQAVALLNEENMFTHEQWRDERKREAFTDSQERSRERRRRRAHMCVLLPFSTPGRSPTSEASAQQGRAPEAIHALATFFTVPGLDLVAWPVPVIVCLCVAVRSHTDFLNPGQKWQPAKKTTTSSTDRW